MRHAQWLTSAVSCPRFVSAALGESHCVTHNDVAAPLITSDIWLLFLAMFDVLLCVAIAAVDALCRWRARRPRQELRYIDTCMIDTAFTELRHTRASLALQIARAIEYALRQEIPVCTACSADCVVSWHAA